MWEENLHNPIPQEMIRTRTRILLLQTEGRREQEEMKQEGEKREREGGREERKGLEEKETEGGGSETE